MSTPLVTLDRLSALHPDAPHLDVTSAAGRARAEAALASASEDVELHLDRTLSVGLVVQPIESWEKPATFARDWPVVQIVSGAESVSGRKKDFLKGIDADEVSYFAGYRQAGETLGNLQALFPQLATLPDELPSLVESVVIDLALEDLGRKAQGASERRVIQMGAGTIETDKMRVGFRTEQLDKLSAYRRLSV